MFGCATPAKHEHAVTALSPKAQASTEQQRRAEERLSASGDPTCPDIVLRVEAGTDRGRVCASEAKALGLTVIELADAWTPTMFAPTGDLTPNIRATYLALASAKDGNEDSLAELYGVVPSLAVVRARLLDDARHACHAAIDNAPITKLTKAWSQSDQANVAAANRTRVFLATQLERERVKRKLPDLAALATVKELATTYTRWKAFDDLYRGLVATQQHYVCENTLEAKYADGNFTWRTGNATEMFQRRNFLMPNERLDDETRESVMLDSRELDYRLALRILRERVVDGSGVIEDGTAGAGPQAVLGRMLDPVAMRGARGGDKPLPNGAPDLVSAMTEAAAKQLGWTGPA
ncbi:MAG: hypothetical protein H0T79_07600, partial [Deltaproteobacteria bacterium]|nr:hypothetical protein [Deltaproteobacteria bacterium]